MKKGDRVLIYHSSQDPPAVVGVAEVVREGYPDPTQFERGHAHYDADSKREAPRWFQVDVRAVKKFPRPVPLSEIRSAPALKDMLLIKRGMRLAVCQMSTRGYAAAIAQSRGGKAADVYKELTEHLVPNSHLVPAGIVAVNRAQERGYSFAYVG